MKKFMCLALALCMVFVLGGAVIADELQTQEVNYNNDTYETNIREEDGIGWMLELVYAIEGDDQPVTIRQYDWEIKDCDECCDFRKSGDDDDDDCFCCDDHCYFLDDPVWLWVDKHDDDLPGWISDDWRDYITKVMLDPDCDYIDDGFNNYPCDDDWVCPALDFPDCIDQGSCSGWDETIGCYPECIPCEVEILYCQWEGNDCELDDDNDCFLQGDCGDDDDDDCCDYEHQCSWWHPYGTGPSSSETAITYDRFEPGDTLSGLKAVPSFTDVVYGWTNYGNDCDENPMEKVCFVTRPKWYDWDVTACDDCDGRVDVVLWSREKPCCPDNYDSCDDDDDCDEACCVPPGPHWAVDKPFFSFVRFFEMDLRNCDNISMIDLGFPVCCPCDDDIMWGVWEWVEADTCDIDECDPECPEEGCEGGCGCECSWVPLNTDFVTDCTAIPCDAEECDCSLQLSFSGACATDENCNVGELCDYEDKVFALGWVAPFVKSGVLGLDTLYEVKAWACDPRNVVYADLRVVDNPDAGISDEDGQFFAFDFLPASGEDICKVKLCIELADGDGLYEWDGEDWVAVASTSDGCFEFTTNMFGVVFGAGDTEVFDPVIVGDDDDDDDNETPGPTPVKKSSGGGCNVGTGAAILLLLAPLTALWFRRFQVRLIHIERGPGPLSFFVCRCIRNILVLFNVNFLTNKVNWYIF